MDLPVSRAQFPVPSACVLLALLVGASGCNSAYRQALERGERALQQGDLMTAAEAYRMACAADRSEKETCRTAQRLAQEAADETVVAIRAECETGNWGACLPRLQRALKLMPEHPDARALLVQSSTLHLENCAALRKPEAVNTEVAEVACLQAFSSDFSMRAYQEHLRQRETQLAARLAQLAQEADEQGAPGAAAVLWSSSDCLVPDYDMNTRSLDRRDEFLNWSHVPVTLYLGGAIPTRLVQGLANPCRRMASELPAWVRCIEPGESSGQRETLHVQVDANIQELQESTTWFPRSVSYISGKRMENNPAYEPARERLEKAEAALKESSQKKSPTASVRCGALKVLQEAACDTCPKPAKSSGCNDAQISAEEYERRVRERDEAKTAFDATPKQVEQVSRDTFHYTEEKHSWWMNFLFTIQTSSERKEPLRHQGTLRFEDVAHVGFAPAGLRADDVKPPRAAELANAFFEELKPQVVRALQQDGALFAARRRKQCPHSPEAWSTSWVQCWAEATLWEEGRMPKATQLLELLAATATPYRSVQCR